MKKIIKILCFCLSIVLILTVSVFATSNDTTNSENGINIVTTDENIIDISPDELNEHLLNNGYPQDLIDSMQEDVKISLYNENAKFVSLKTTYSILTDNYDITYELDDNYNVIMNTENQNKLSIFINDELAQNEIKKNNTSYISDKIKNKIGEENIDDSNVFSYPVWDKNSKQIILYSMDQSTNFSESIFVSNIHYDDSTYTAKKKINYSFSWGYKPFVCDQESIGIAWSDKWLPIDSLSYGQVMDVYKYASGYNGGKTLYRNYRSMEKYLPNFNIGGDAPIGGTSYKFNLYKWIINGDTKNITFGTDKVGKYVFSGTDGYCQTYITMVKDVSIPGNNTQTIAAGRYFHNTINVFGSPVEISGSGPSFSIGIGVGHDPSNGVRSDPFYIK